MNELLQFANQYHLDWILVFSAMIMIWIDFYFFVDWPAFVGYLLFSLASIIMVPLSLGASIGMGLGILVLLLALHVLVFAKYLTNAQGN